MSSWRETTSLQAQTDLDGLVGAALGFAQQQLAAHGEFFPFAAAVDANGTAELMSARPNLHDEHPAAAAVFDACVTTLRSKRTEIRAGAIVSDVRLHERGVSDAIQVELEHVEGPALTVILPYAKASHGNIDHAPIRAQAGQHRIWNNKSKQ